MIADDGILKVAIAGDICMRNITELVDADFSRAALSEIQPILDSADVRLINLENPFIDSDRAIAKSGPSLKAKPENIAFLGEGHFNCALLANNHIGDYGEEGVYSTLITLDEAGIGHAGAGRNLDESYAPWYCEANGLKLAVIAVCENEFGIAEQDKAGTAGLDTYRVYHAIKNAKIYADFVIIIIHGGNEYNPIPTPRTVSRYRLFAEFGADAVIGMHPHCMQGFELYNHVPIVYSTGNFLFSKPIAEDPKDSWYHGYLPFISFKKGEPASLEVIPYHFNKGCTLISPLKEDIKIKMLSYLDEISRPIQDEKLLTKFFMGWCVISGTRHGGYIVYKPEYLDEQEFPTGHPLLPLRNMHTCEAANEMMTAFFKMLADGKLDTGKSMTDEIKRLQKMPV